MKVQVYYMNRHFDTQIKACMSDYRLYGSVLCGFSFASVAIGKNHCISNTIHATIDNGSTNLLYQVRDASYEPLAIYTFYKFSQQLRRKCWKKYSDKNVLSQTPHGTDDSRSTYQIWQNNLVPKMAMLYKFLPSKVDCYKFQLLLQLSR